MGEYCQFHPFTKGKWYCEQCNESYCSKCPTHSRNAPEKRFCPECNEALTEQITQQSLRVRPWHQAIHLIFNDRTRTWAAFYLLAVFATSFYLSQYLAPLALSAAMISAVGLWVGVGLVKTLSSTHASLNGMPTFLDVFNRMRTGRSLVLTAQLSVVIAAAFASYWMGWGVLSLVVVVLAIAVCPLWIIREAVHSEQLGRSRARSSKAMTDSRVSSLDILGTLKERYVELVLIGGGSVLVLSVLSSYLVTILSPSLAFSAVTTTGLCVGGLSAVAIGFAARHIALSAHQAAKKPVVSHEPQKFDDVITVSLKTGRYNLILDQLEQSYLEEQSGYRLEQFYKAMMFTKNWNALERYSHKILEHLLVRAKHQECASFLQVLKDRKSQFSIWDAGLCGRLAKVFETMKLDSMVLWLAIDAHKRFPADPGIVSDLYFSVAHVLEAQGQSSEKIAAFRRFAFKLKSDAERAGMIQPNQSFVTKPPII